MANLTTLFAQKLTENGDLSYNTTGSTMLDILFMTEFWQHHLDAVPYIGTSDKEKLFAMFIRDGRFGIGRRDLGRVLMKNTECSIEDIILAGRIDDLWVMFKEDKEKFHEILDFLKVEIANGNELAKKWMPRYSSKNLAIAREIAEYWFPEVPTKNGARKVAYQHFVRLPKKTVESKLSQHAEDEIKFEQVPSLASVKYAHAFATKECMKERYAEFISAVKSGDAKIHVATTNCYDIYRNCNTEGFDADAFFSQLEKININAIAVIDSSSSMRNSNDCYGKAMAVGHYIAKNSSYMPGHVISFSSKPTLLKLGVPNTFTIGHGWYCRQGGEEVRTQTLRSTDQYHREIESMHTGDCSNTDFGAVMRLLQGLDKENAPEWLIVLSDMEFDAGSNMSLEQTMKLFKENEFPTKIVWWNFNNRATTAPQMKEGGNVYLSGYNPMLLKYLEAGFNGEQFLDKLLNEYKKNIGK